MAARIGAALIDLSGTLHVEDSVIPCAIEALCRFVSQYFMGSLCCRISDNSTDKFC